MKNLVLVLAISLGIFSSVVHAAPMSEIQTPAEVSTSADYGGSALDSSCYAWANCWNGARIQCYSYGASCTWYTVPGQSVTCCNSGYWGSCVQYYCW